MSTKFLITYTRPAKKCRRILETVTPEQAAALVHKTYADAEDVVVKSLEDPDDLVEPEIVHAWCAVCGLPIWQDDDTTSYRTYTADDTSDAVTSHATCLKGA